MVSVGRYEIVNKVASGDFATVYRARDRELGREVAVKQIHQQFLGDPRQLERYWREAQLLASLQHPNILTIYDIVRPRGWLILELMRGNLQQTLQVEPVDLDYLRVVLIQSLNALQFLHVNGIIHGDVKPSNLLVDQQNRVKLGDFGLARRASSEQGSLLKGTTKYMAPELVANQFGPVGPASDLYSLGFAAYELMCGPQFETLFPGLAAFGRDRQIAWLMWHAAPDRNLPEITRVLQGVPDDLVRVVSRLVTKNQSDRYRSAQEALLDLRTDAATLSRAETGQAAPETLDGQKKRRLRIGVILAVACSVILMVVAFLMPKPEPVRQEEPQAVRGIVRNVYLDEWKFVIERSEDGRPEEVSVKPRDEVLINDKKELLRNLQPGDRAAIETYRDSAGRKVTRIVATRPQVHQGLITEVDAPLGRLTLASGQDEREHVISVSDSAPILFNGRKDLDGRPVKLPDLRPEDRAVVSHIGDDSGVRTATELSVERVVTFEGVIRDVDLKKNELTVAQGEGSRVKAATWPFAPKCEITVNDRRFIDQQMLRPADLKPGDKATVAHDKRIVRVHAYRILGREGVIESVQFSGRTIEVKMEGQNKPTTVLIGPKCRLTLAGEPIELGDLRAGDRVDITHDSPDAKSPEALAMTVRRPADPGRWAILAAVQNFDDRSLSPLERPLDDAKLLQETLVKRNRVPENQAELLSDASQVRLEQAIPDILQRIKPGDTMLLYLAGHAYRDSDGKVYYAPKNFNLKQPAASGVALQWIVDQLEKCQAKEKLLLLDCTHSGTGADLAQEPSAAEMVQSLKPPPGMAALRTVTVIASCAPGQRGHDWPAKKHGAMAAAVALGYSGEADKNRDNRLEITELSSYLTQALASAGAQIGQPQTPILFLPDARPPRLSEEARKSIRALAGFLREDKIDAAAVKRAFEAADRLAGKEVEPKLLYGLILARAKQRAEATSHFEQLKTAHPDLMLSLGAMAWLRFSARNYQSGVNELADFVSRIPRPKQPADPCPEASRRWFSWAGQLREFAGAVQDARAVSEESLQRVDAAVVTCGDEAVRCYEQGRAKTQDTTRAFDRQHEAAPDDATKLKLRVDRRQLTNYASFPFEAAAKDILTGLDQ